MTVFKKNSLVLNVSIDGQSLFALEQTDEYNNRNTVFDLTQGVIIFNLSATDIVIQQQDFPATDEESFIIEIHNRWPHISYDGNRNLIFAGAIGVGMGTVEMIDNPSLESTYSTGTSVQTYFNYLSKHQLSIKTISGKTIKFKSSS